MRIDQTWLETDFYEVLGVDADATAADVAREYRTRARALHPDVSEAPDAARRFAALAQAYSVVGDPRQRRAYDQIRGKASPEERPSPSSRPRIRGDDRGHVEGRAVRREPSSATAVDSRDGRHVDGPPTEVVADLAVPHLAAARGSVGRVAVPGHGTVILRIPPGSGDGDVIRLPVRGADQYGRLVDLVITIRIRD